jgi:hypothetical protein
LSPSVKAKTYDNNVAAQTEAKRILQGLQDEGRIKRVDGEFREKDINCASALGGGAKYVGGGDYGAFVTMPATSLLGEEGRGLRVGVKTGRIGTHELEALRIAGDNGIGPRLLGAKTSNREETDNYGNQFRKGAIAMTKVGALSYNKAPEVWGGESKSDMLWRAAAGLHKAGVAHNDMHGGNVLLSANGKAYFVDFGLAQVSPKAALLEAVGAITGGNWQFKGSTDTGLGAVVKDNLPRVRDFLLSKGLSRNQIYQELFEMEIRRGDGEFKQGFWKRLSNDDARKAIEILYEGV